MTPLYTCGAKFSRIFLAAVLMMTFTLGQAALPAQAATDYTAWQDQGIVYTAPSGGAYYPSVIYTAGGFGSGSPLYKLWYSNGSGGVFVITSTTGISWNTPTALTGLGNDAHHVQVLYDANCFGTAPCDTATAKYKIWYWDIDANLYSIAAIATAQSTDGVNWTGDTALAQTGAPLVTGVSTDWNYGSYGPVTVFYQPGATNSGTEPWDYTYVMYYDGATGQSEVTGLAYSADGLTWTRYGAGPVLDKGTGSSWDSDDSTYGTVSRDAGGWHYWYSGGSCLYDVSCPVYEGIGYASSTDGKAWAKDGGNPIFHFTDGISYRNRRVYTPAVVNDGSGIQKMYYSAVGTDGIKKIGLATTTPATTFVDDDWAAQPPLAQVAFPGDPNPHFMGIDAFATLQGGINAVASGGTVRVAAGMYAEAVTISQSLTLYGNPGDSLVAGAEPSNAPILDGAGLPGNPTAMTLNPGVSNVTISGFDIQNYVTAGISTTNSSGVTLINNTFQGIYSNACNPGNSIYVRSAGTNNLSALTIAYNVISNTLKTGEAILLRADDTASMSSVTIAHNLITNPQSGIVAKTATASNGIFNGLSITDNQITLPTDKGCFTSNAGIYLKNLQGDNLIENNIVDTAKSSAFSGIALLGSSNSGSLSIGRNTLTGSGNPGIFFTASYVPGSTAITITEGEIQGYNVGIMLPNVSFSPVPAVHGNSIHDNKWAEQGIRYTGPTILDAASNWWGTASPEGVAASISSTLSVNYTPWLCNGTDTDPATPGFQPDMNNRCAIATRLVFSTQPGGALSNQPLNPQPVVRAEDASGNLGIGFTGTVSLVIDSNPGGGALTGTTAVSATNGVATFTNVSIDTAGVGYTLRASAVGLTPTTSAPFTITTPAADLAITKTDAVTTVVSGAADTYVVTVTNPSAQAVTSAIVTDTFPSNITDVTWTCMAASGSSCPSPASGSGNLSATIDLAAGGVVTFTLTGRVSGLGATTVSNTAYVTAPGGITDPDPTNNSATDTDAVSYRMYLPLIQH